MCILIYNITLFLEKETFIKAGAFIGINTVLCSSVSLMSFFQGVTYPSIHAVWSKWAPPLEKTKLATLAFSGMIVFYAYFHWTSSAAAVLKSMHNFILRLVLMRLW